MPRTPTAVLLDAQPSTAPLGPATILGIISTLVATIGAVIAAIQTNDVATATAGLAAILTTVATLGGRYAQAVATIRSAATVAEPYVHALTKPDEYDPTNPDDEDLPSDDEEFAALPPDVAPEKRDAPIMPSQDDGQ